MKKSTTALALVLAVAACAGEDDTDSTANAPLQLETLNETTIAGTFIHGASVVEFRSESPDQKYATLALNVNGAQIDVELNLTDQLYSEDGYLNALYAPDLAALLALRDELHASYPDLVTETLQGKLLARHADRLAEAPVGYTHDYRFIDMTTATKIKTVENRADADGCGGDGATCLYGTSGYEYAVYDPGDNGTCVWQWSAYGGNTGNCTGRCGAGCNWFDNDYTWDCLDHDRCVDAYGGSTLSGNSNCGDEFWDASDDYALTYGPWC